MSEAFETPVGRLLDDPVPRLDPGLEAWNRTEAPFSRHRAVHSLFEDAASRAPGAPACRFGPERASYRELDAWAGRVAAELARRGIGLGGVVGICMEPAIARVAAMLGVLKAGAAYLPLDPDLPDARIAFQLGDARAALTLADRPNAGRAPLGRGATVTIDELSGSPAAGSMGTVPADAIAYVMYTSGSTGRPKGVAIRHRSLVNRLEWMRRALAVGASDRVLHKAAFGFDVSVWEQLLPLIAGAELVVAPAGARGDAVALGELIGSGEVTIAHFVPTLLGALLESGVLARCGSLRATVCSGEALPLPVAAAFARQSSSELFNYYGPTEATIDVTAWRFASDDDHGFVPLGRPIANTSVYVLDSALVPVPVGDEGELHLGGAGLAAFYAGRPAMSAERFVPDPFAAAPGARMYRTGDRVRLHPGGVLEFLGRTDRQVKVRGHRIEPGEVEARLLAHPDVAQAAVVPRDSPGSGAQLVAYVVLRAGAGLRDANALGAWLADELPDYMVPIRFVALDELPTLPSGKVDRARLAEPEPATRRAGGRRPVAGVERALAAIWGRLLEIEEPGVDEDFFELGGDSIASIRLVARARAEGIVFEVRDVFDHPTIAGLAGLARSLEPVAADLPAPLACWAGTAGDAPVTVVLEPRRSLDEERLAAAAPGVRVVEVETREGRGVAVDAVARELAGEERAAPALLRCRHSGAQRLVVAARAASADRDSLIELARQIERGYRAARGGGPAAGPPPAVEPADIARDSDSLELGASEWAAPQIARAEGTPAPYRARLARTGAALTAACPPWSPTAARHVAQGALLVALGRAGQRAAVMTFAEDRGWAAQTGWDVRHTRGRLAARRRAPVELDPAAGWRAVRTVKDLVRGRPASGGAAAGALEVDVEWLALHDGAIWRELPPQPAVAPGADLAVTFVHGPDGLDVLASARPGTPAPDPAELIRAVDASLEELIGASALPPLEARTASDFPGSGLTDEQVRSALRDVPDVTDCYGLAPMQEGLLVRSLYWPESDAYHNQNVIELRGPLDVGRFERAWMAAVDRYEILRTGFRWEGLDAPVQVVAAGARPRVVHVDWLDHDGEDEDDRLARLLDEDRAQPFDLSQPGLYRLYVIRAAPRRTLLVWSHHHVLLDGWCLSLIWGDVLRHYESDGQAELPAPRRFRDYVRWLAAREVSDADRRFWHEYLAGFDEATPFSPAPRDLEGRFETVRTRRDAAGTAAIAELARTARVTPNAVVQAAWSLMLSAWTGRRDVVHGVSISGRPPELPGVERMVGLFINSVPLRVAVRPTATVAELLRHVQSQLAAASAHGHVPLTAITGCWPGRGDNRRLFDGLVAFESYPEDNLPGEQIADLRVIDRFALEKTEYPIGLIVLPGPEMELHFHYDTAHFGADRFGALRDLFEAFLDQMTADPDARLRDLGLSMPGRDRGRPDPFGPPAPARARATPLGLVEAAAAGRPGAPALEANGTSISYGRLLGEVGGLAARLRHAGVRFGDAVALVLPRSVGFVRALLAVQHLGAVPVLLDPDAPEERLRLALGDSGTSAGLVTSADRRLPGAVSVGADPPFAADATPARRDHPVAYMAYTSGSTGAPKGVMCSREGLVNRLAWTVGEYASGPPPRLLLNASTSFDIVVWEALFPLVAGGTVVEAPPPAPADVDALAAAVAAHGVSVLHLTPSLLRLFVESPHAASCTSLRVLVTGGEVLAPELVRRFAGLGLECRLHHAYGPTEASISVTDRLCAAGDAEGARVPLGRPVAGCSCHVLDDALRPVPAGVEGELFLGGRAPALGYRDRPGETASRFLPDPFAPEPGARMYRTGDRARWRPDGQLEFLGRRDGQVKLRGHRVELGEVETILGSHPWVRRVAVIATGDTLAAFVVPGPGAPPDLAALQGWLAQRLPSWMVPATVTGVRELPTTSTGKVDRRRLDGLARGSRRQAPGAPPRNELERAIASTWAEVLGETVGVHDDVFQLGAHSLSVMRVLSGLRRRLPRDVRVELPQLFKASTPAELAELVLGPLDGSGSRHVTTLAEGGPGPPLLLVHPVQGLTFAYQALRGRLPGRAVYAFSNPRFGDGERPFRSVTEMASVYVEWARRLAPRQPVALGGWSFGGVVALEMARQLVAHRSAVDTVLLLDSYNLAGRSISADPVAWLERWQVDGDADLLIAEATRNAALARTVVERPYEGRVVLLRASEPSREAAELGELRGWDRALLPRLEVVDLPGSHDELLDTGHAEATAAALAAALSG